MPIQMMVGLPLISVALVALATPWAKRIAARYGIVSVPYTDSRHQRQTPLMGGAAIITAILTTLAFGQILPLWLLLGTAGFFVIGLVDDTIVLRPSRKFLLQLVVVTFVLAAGPAFRLAPWPAVNAALAGFFLLATVNAFNLIDGLDGLAAGVGIIVAVGTAAISYLHGDMAGAARALVIAGALAGFLVYNSIRRRFSWVTAVRYRSACCSARWPYMPATSLEIRACPAMSCRF